jgi:hypothetical protein
MSPQAWQLQLALGACRAGRYLATASLACALLSLALLACQPSTWVCAWSWILACSNG